MWAVWHNVARKTQFKICDTYQMLVLPEIDVFIEVISYKSFDRTTKRIAACKKHISLTLQLVYHIQSIKQSNSNRNQMQMHVL